MHASAHIHCGVTMTKDTHGLRAKAEIQLHVDDCRNNG